MGFLVFYASDELLSLAFDSIPEGDGFEFLNARKLLSRPPHRKRSDRGRASGSEGVWGERGAEEGRDALVTLLRTGDFPRLDAVAVNFMRSSVVCENGRPLRFAKLYFEQRFFLTRSPLESLGVASPLTMNWIGTISAPEVSAEPDKEPDVFEILKIAHKQFSPIYLLLLLAWSAFCVCSSTQ